MHALVLALLPVLGAGPTPAAQVRVPGGDFTMGAADSHFDEAPVHRVSVSAFSIDRLETSTAGFAAFVRASEAYDAVEGPWFRASTEGCVDLLRHLERRYGGVLSSRVTQYGRNGGTWRDKERDFPRWKAALADFTRLTGEDASAGVEKVATAPAVAKAIAVESSLPVRFVTWRDAQAYCAAGQKRLPTEAEWEKAARGTDGRVFPWGASFDAERCVLGAGRSGPDPVGSHPACTSASGALDMAGNVWEWVADWYDERFYARPGSHVDPRGPVGLANGELPRPRAGVDLLRSPLQGREPDTRKVIRGGSFGGPDAIARDNARATRRLYSNPGAWHPDVGFRCVSTGR